MVEHIDETQSKKAEHVQGEGNQELEKVAIVSPSHAVVHPRAVMIKHLNRNICTAKLHQTEIINE